MYRSGRISPQKPSCSSCPECEPQKHLFPTTTQLISRYQILTMRFRNIFALYCITNAATSQACRTDEDCSLNGLCRTDSSWLGPPHPKKTCECDPGWFGDDCGRLDLRPATKNNGYNHSIDATASNRLGPHGNSSWGGTILQDPHDPRLFHLVASQFADGCGLSGWRPFSFIMRAESRSGPQGPYHYVDNIRKPFRHNPEVIWSPADEKYLLYTIGVDDNEEPERDNCSSLSNKQWPNNISVSTAQDIRGPWSPFELVLASVEPHSTNPSPYPLWTSRNRTGEIVLAVEDLAIFSGPRIVSCGATSEAIGMQLHIGWLISLSMMVRSGRGLGHMSLRENWQDRGTGISTRRLTPRSHTR